VGIAKVPEVRVGMPEVVEFDLPGSVLTNAVQPGASRYCLLVILTSTSDPFANKETDPDKLCISERKAAQKSF
jgi:hypothetical protein